MLSVVTRHQHSQAHMLMGLQRPNPIPQKDSQVDWQISPHELGGGQRLA